MTIEASISELVAAVKELTAALQAGPAPKADAKKPPAKDPQNTVTLPTETASTPHIAQESAAQEPKESPSAVTLADAKPAFLDFVKAKGVPAAQVLLKKYGGDLLSKVPEERLAALVAELKAST
jgi:hypothetical protein